MEHLPTDAHRQRSYIMGGRFSQSKEGVADMGKKGPGIVTAAELDTLALRVRGRESGAMLELWEAVRRFVVMLARRQAATPGCRTTVEDLTQAGFLAVITTADQYEPGAGHSFIQVLSFSLRKAFAEESGTRSTKRDALQYADSIEVAAYRDDPGGPTVGELLPHDGAALAFMGVEYVDFLEYCRREIRAALDTLPLKYAALLRLHYLEGKTLEEAATLCGLSSKQAASEAKYRALQRLEHGRHRRELRECLVAFEDFREYQEAAKRDTWAKTGLSRTEAAALVKI